MIGTLLIGLALWTLLLWKVGDAYRGFLKYRGRAESTGFPVIETRECIQGLE